MDEPKPEEGQEPEPGEFEESEPEEVEGPKAEKVEQLEKREDVRVALEQVGPKPEKPAVEKLQLAWVATYLLVLGGLGVVLYLLRYDVFPLTARVEAFLERLTIGAMAVVAVLAAAKTVDTIFLRRLASRVTAFNLRRVLRALTALGVLVIVASVLSASWYTALVSLGVASLILGFALQTPIMSFLGWIYILLRAPYRVGDRIRIGDVAGDVIDVGYIDTMLWEFGGEYLSTDHPSGRVIKLPNHMVLNEPVINYSWPLFPYIWNEISLQIGYDSDLDYVSRVLKEVADEQVGPKMRERVRTFREILAKTPVDEFEVREEPAVFFRVSSNTWIEATVRYLVHPRRGGRKKTDILTKALKRLNEEPERVRFPKGDAR